ncbi:RING/U-box superfamily protein [Actinidia rufa]|uniref:RING/U-box superfamily protein n=1 Tax=Actinidia rufa TaxID=165716 RepID=A0A7J0GMC9_9ERIC|nr:RING/U-box superfamily protein [Actinidia rufa]
MMDYYQFVARSSYQDSLKVLEADIQHSNMLAASIPRAKGNAYLQMKLVHNHFAPVFWLLLQWMDCSSVILPSLQHLYDNNSELDLDHDEDHDFEMIVRKRLEDEKKHSDVDLERQDECGICLEPCTKMVLPTCCHAMCINCYRDWSMRSESCPFCRGSLKRVNSGDLWVLTCSGDVIDAETASKEDMLHFNLYINSLPKDVPDALFFMYYEYLI